MKKDGQSIVEYALIAILVILGIVFMGTYVLRSVNGHFKLWDEGVQDSFQENLTQAPLNDMPAISTNCQCNPVEGTSCGGSGLLCAANQREVDYNCTIEGCNGAQGNSYCVTDNSCCSANADVGCGNVALPTDASGTIDTSLETTNQNPPQLPAPGNCYYGQQILESLCGSTSSIQCSPVSSTVCPMPACTGFLLFGAQSATYCATHSSTGPTAGLTQNTPITYVGNSDANCNSSITMNNCQVYCNPPYTVNATNSGCTLQFNVASISCSPKLDTNFPGCSCSGSSCSASNGTSCPASSTSTCDSCSCTSSNAPWTVVTNTENFTTCVDPSSTIASVSLLPYGATVTSQPNLSGPNCGKTGQPACPSNNGGCGNPGEPGQTCAVQINF